MTEIQSAYFTSRLLGSPPPPSLWTTGKTWVFSRKRSSCYTLGCRRMDRWGDPHCWLLEARYREKYNSLLQLSWVIAEEWWLQKSSDGWMTGPKEKRGGGEFRKNQNNDREETVFGRSYLLGNRKGLAGLKNRKEEINQVYILESKQQPIKNRPVETLEKEWTACPQQQRSVPAWVLDHCCQKSFLANLSPDFAAVFSWCY